MAKLKRDKATLYDKLAAAAPHMMQSDLLLLCRENNKTLLLIYQTVLMKCMHVLLTHRSLEYLWLQENDSLTFINIMREDVKIKPIETTVHHFEVRKKDIYEVLRGDKYLKPSRK